MADSVDPMLLYHLGLAGMGPQAAPTDWGAVQQQLAQRPVQGVNVHPAPQGLHQAYIDQDAIQPIPFGSLADPVSQAAFLLAPGLQAGLSRATGNVGEALTYGRPGMAMTQGYRAAERGNLGPVPRGPQGEPLPGSVVRNEAGELQRLYHGTDKVYPDFELGKMNPDDWAKGVFMTTDPQVAGGYATQGWSDEAKDALRSVQQLQDLRAYHETQAAQARTLPEALEAMQTAETYRSMEAQATERLQRHMTQSPWLYRDPAHIRPVYADLKQPFDLDARLSPQDAHNLLQHVGFAEGDVHEMLHNAGMDPAAGISGKDVYTLLADEHAQGTAGANQVLTQQGYDGLTHTAVGQTYGNPHRVYLAFEPSQVYPSFNVDALRQTASESPLAGMGGGTP